jgi:membrane-associated protein
MIEGFLEFLLHLDQHLDQLTQHYGTLTFAILFAVIFAETGLVVAPFLPGDSLLFAAGTLAARGSLDVTALVVLLALAAILGDTVNYWIGAAVGPRVFARTRSRLFNPEHLERTRRFYDRYGSITIVLARFLPIIRTFAPFMAGIARMQYGRFLLYNVLGGIVWVVLFVLGGYLFGNLPIVRRNFSLVIAAIIIISLLPAGLEALRRRRQPPPAGKASAARNDRVKDS